LVIDLGLLTLKTLPYGAVDPALPEYRVGIIPNFKEKSTKISHKKAQKKFTTN
jgi:hypothetical protein